MGILIMENQLDIIEILIHKNNKKNYFNSQYLSKLLLWGTYSCNLKIIKLLLDNGADINVKDNKNKGTTLLHWAAISDDDADIFKFLFYKYQELYENQPEELKKIINKKDDEGISILHIAAWNGNIEIIKLLLDNGADINVKDNNGEKSILFIASNINLIKNNCLNVSKRILEKNMNFNEKDNFGNNILHIIAKNKNSKIFKQFIDLVNINEKNMNFETPLHIAVNNNNIEIVKLLLANGADVNAKDKKNKTPFDWASYKNYFEIVNILKKFNELNKKIIICNILLKNIKYEKQKTKINNNLKENQDKLKELLKIKLSDLITKTNLKKISDNSSQKILNRVNELNPNLDINKIKVKDNSITKTTAIVTNNENYYFDEVTVTFKIAKKENNSNDIKKITEDKYKKSITP